jgi:hypothetical protein
MDFNFHKAFCQTHHRTSACLKLVNAQQVRANPIMCVGVQNGSFECRKNQFEFFMLAGCQKVVKLCGCYRWLV